MALDGDARRADDRQAVQATPAAAATRADRRERLAAVPRRELWRRERRDRQLVPRHGLEVPAEEGSRPRPGGVAREDLKRPVSNFDGDTSAALWAYKAAIEKGNGTRSGINTALETKLRGLVTPAGKIFLSKINHTGLQMGSMWVGKIQGCKLKPLFGAAFEKKK